MHIFCISCDESGTVGKNHIIPGIDNQPCTSFSEAVLKSRARYNHRYLFIYLILKSVIVDITLLHGLPAEQVI